jgi:hypothetical protein
VRIDGDERPDLVGVRYSEHGSPGLGGTGETRYEIALLGPAGTGPERVIRRAEIGGDGGVSVSTVDLDGDGRHELLVNEHSNYMYCDISTGGGSSSRWLIIDGEGRELWADELRGRSYGEGGEHDETARVAVLDLTGDGRRAIRLRTFRAEWYVLPRASQVPDAIPACIE